MLFDFLKNKLTRNQIEIPLLYVNFDYKYYLKYGKAGSCDLVVHPLLKDDEYIKETLNNLVDYIRNNHRMEEM